MAVLGTIVSPFRLLLINNASIHRTEASVQELLRDLITLTITRVRFDPNGPSELYVYYELLNPGEQTILRNWRLLIRTAKRSDPIIITPRFIETGRHENIENNPIERGGKREGKFGFTFGGAAKDIVGDRGATFNLSAVDVKGRKIEASYSCNTIADHDYTHLSLMALWHFQRRARPLAGRKTRLRSPTRGSPSRRCGKLGG